MAGSSSALHVVRSTLVLALVRVGKTAVSMAVTVLLASRLGAAAPTDAFLWARRLTMGLAESFGAVIRAAYVPQLVRTMRAEGVGVVRRVLLVHALRVGAVALVVAVLVSTFAGDVVRVLAPGFGEEPTGLATRCLAILAFLVPVSLLLALVTAVFHAVRRFAVPALVGQLLPPVLLLATLLLLVPPMGVTGLAGVLLGGSLLCVVALVPGLGRMLEASGDAPGPEKKAKLELRMGHHVLPVLFMNIGFAQAVEAIDLLFASRLPEGSVSVLDFGRRLVQVVPNTLTSSMVWVMLSEFSHRSADGGVGMLQRSLVRAQRMALFAVLPIAATLIVGAGPIVDVLLKWGKFDAEAAARTADFMRFAAPAVLFAMLNAVFLAGAYVDDDLPRLAIFGTAAAVGVAVRVALNAALVEPLGLRGIAIADTVTVLVVMLATYALLRRRWGAFVEGRDLAAVGRMAAAVVPSAAAMVFAARAVDAGDDASLALRFVRLAFVAASGAGVYLGAAAFLRVPELGYAKELLQRRRKGRGGEVS